MGTVKTTAPTFSNIVKKKQLREVQKETLATLKESLMLSAGPYGSTTGIIRNGEFTEYTKDGHTILSGIKFNKSIEAAIQQELAELTRYIVVKVGDGTTSAVILSSLIFDELCAMEADTKIPPYKIISEFKKVVTELKKLISDERRELTLQDVYNIAMICTNSNEDISNVLWQIYNKHGLDVFIDVNVSTTHENIVKSYDGLTLEAGYSDPAYINTAGVGNGDAGTCIVRDANVYAFQDPIDTIEMVNFFVDIISNNIMDPLKEYGRTGNDIYLQKVKPTVILAPKISIDSSSIMTELISYMYQYGPNNLADKPPLLVITNIDSINYEIYSDIWRLCDCKVIKKYVDPEIQKRDIEEGKAPTHETIASFCGYAEEVKSDAFKTTFINPKDMFTVNEQGERVHSAVYQSQLNFLEQELRRVEAENGEIDVLFSLKRRVHSLKANMVDYLIGGATVTDRDSVRALVEDAVKNIRSAAQNGVGYGANYEGLRAAYRYSNNIAGSVRKDDESKAIAKAIYTAYIKLSNMLYETAMDETNAVMNVKTSLTNNCGPINLTNSEFDKKVLSTIDSDITILDVISKIITVMFTTNQMLVQTPQHNMYIDTDEL